MLIVGNQSPSRLMRWHACKSLQVTHMASPFIKVAMFKMPFEATPSRMALNNALKLSGSTGFHETIQVSNDSRVAMNDSIMIYHNIEQTVA